MADRAAVATDRVRPGPVRPDVATLAARFGAALRAEGVPAGPERCERFAAAVALVAPAGTRELYRCALATLVSHPDHVAVLDRVFRLVFGGVADPAEARGQAGDGGPQAAPPPPGEPRTSPGAPRAAAGGPLAADRAAGDAPDRQEPHLALAAATERLSTRDFAELTGAELAELAAAMRQLRLVVPLRRSRRRVPASRGRQVDLRATLRHAGRTAGHPVRLRRRRQRLRPRRLVVLCDISGSMAPYARALLQFLYCAAGGVDAEVFTFATRLTRLTRTLARVSPAVALARAGRVAPDWSGGTRIGEALQHFNHGYGARGMARQAVVLVVSDGWETGDPSDVERQMARLSRLAYRIVWANPRSAAPGFQPLAGGMAAAWPYCDAVVSAHHLAALGDLLAALGAQRAVTRAGAGAGGPAPGARQRGGRP